MTLERYKNFTKALHQFAQQYTDKTGDEVVLLWGVKQKDKNVKQGFTCGFCVTNGLDYPEVTEMVISSIATLDDSSRREDIHT